MKRKRISITNFIGMTVTLILLAAWLLLFRPEELRIPANKTQ